MLAWLPHCLGGYGFPLGAMNKIKKVAGRERKCDLYFTRKRVGIEYESDENHSGTTNIARDSARRTSFENKGYRIVTMTNGEFKDPRQSFETMRLVGKLIDVRVREPQGRSAEARKKLHRFVLTPHVAYF